jgi:hypothetical protein
MTPSGPVQVIHPKTSIRVSVVDLTTLGEEEQRSRLRELIRDEATRGFDLTLDHWSEAASCARRKRSCCFVHDASHRR